MPCPEPTATERSETPPSLATLLEEVSPRLVGYMRLRASVMLRARESSADLAQSVCREAWEARGSFRYLGRPQFWTWIVKLAEAKLAGRRRYWETEKRDPAREALHQGDTSAVDEACLASALQRIATPSRDAASREELERTQRALDQLPEDYRQVILLDRVLGLPQAEIAVILGRSAGAVRVLLSRALARLATLLA